MLRFNFEIGKPKYVERNTNGDVMNIMDMVSMPTMLSISKGLQKQIFCSPAFMSPAKKIMDLASQGRFIAKDSKDNVISDKALYDIMPIPNSLQTWTEFISLMMLNALSGVAVLYVPNNRLNVSNTIHLLKLDRIQYKDNIIKKLSRMVGLNKGSKLFKETCITYNFEDGETKDIPLSELKLISALPIGLCGNLFDSLSLINILYKVIVLAEETIDADYVNTHLSKKVIVTKKAQGTDNFDLPMGDDEKDDIEHKVKSKEWVTATNKDVDAKRLVDNKGNLKLVESYINWAKVIEDMLGVSPDIGAFGRGTYDNQELATGRTIEFAVRPILEKFIDIIEQVSDYDNLDVSFEHMSFNQIFEERKEKKNEIKLKNITLALEKGLIDDSRAKELTEQIFVK